MTVTLSPGESLKLAVPAADGENYTVGGTYTGETEIMNISNTGGQSGNVRTGNAYEVSGTLAVDPTGAGIFVIFSGEDDFEVAPTGLSFETLPTRLS